MIQPHLFHTIVTNMNGGYEMIRKVNLSISICLLLALFLSTSFAGAQPPSYAEWGKIAIQETTKQYPEDKVVEYTYDGKVFISDERHQYNFEFTLKSADEQSKKVRVYVLANNKTDKLIDVYFDDIEEF